MADKQTEQAATPSEEIVEEMSAHFATVHKGKAFRLERDVSYFGNLSEGATLTYFASEEEGEGFYCSICHGRTLPKKIPYGSPERNAKVRRDHPEVWELARKIGLENLGEATPEQLIEACEHLEEITEEFDRGHYAKAARVEVARAKQRRTKQKGRDPRAASRIENAKAWMLERYAEIGNREVVWDELIDLLKTDPERHRQLIGDDRPITHGTAKRWWEDIDDEERQAAKAAYNTRPAEERKREAAERRAYKVRGLGSVDQQPVGPIV
ncbi:MAG TPA: hypothetical protein VND98_03080 [Solirubrobacterales bacterium]|nr:hypothetical protein [Solirubrobacterales bacterium]